jgi:cysteinyl-tRNA synthetase
MANYWMHNGFLQVEGEKMSKSLGNFVTIRELLRTKKFGGQKWKGYVLKFAMLQTHYSQPIDWTVRLLEQSEARLNRWREFAAERTVRRRDKGFFNDFVNALADDLNTPAAFAIVDKRISGEFPTEEERYTVYKILRLLGVRGRQTRVARVAAGFGALFDSVQSIPSEAWSEIDLKIEQANFITLIETKSYPEFEIVASLEAIGEYWRAFRFRTFNFDVAQILLSEDGPRYRGKRDLRALADSFRRRMQDLGCFSKNDWQNFLATVAERPRFKSGNLKPEAELISYLQALSNVDQSHRSNWALHSKELLELKETLLKSAEPPESEFEKQVRRLIADREIARRERRYADADRIRNELAAMRVVLKDAKDPKSGEIKTTWEIAR